MTAFVLKCCWSWTFLPFSEFRLSNCPFVCLPLGVWDKVLSPVAEKRAESGTLKLFPVYLKGEDLFGLTVPAVVKITESVCSAFVLSLNSNQFELHPAQVLTQLLYGTRFCSSLEWKPVSTTHSVLDPTLWWSCPS